MMSAVLAPPRNPPYVGPAYPWRSLVLVVAAHSLVLITLSRLDRLPSLPEAPTLTVDLLTPPAPMAPVAAPAPPTRVEKRPSPRPQPAAQARAPLLATAGPSPVDASAPPAPPAPPASAAPAAPSAATVPATLTQARFDADYLHNPAPTYPPISRRLGEEGKVVLRVFVESNGRAAQVEIRTASGSTRLDQAAADAVAQWKFVPARRGEESVGAWVLVPIIFSLKG